MRLIPAAGKALATRVSMLAALMRGTLLMRSAWTGIPRTTTMAHFLANSMALAEAHDLQGAVEETGEAVRLAPNSPLPHFNCGRVCSTLDGTHS
jgi:hypothetical protein